MLTVSRASANREHRTGTTPLTLRHSRIDDADYSAGPRKSAQEFFPIDSSRKTTCGKLLGMTKPPDYIPKPGDPVKVEGVIIKLVVVGVNPPAKTALVANA